MINSSSRHYKTDVLFATIPELLIKGQEADDARTVYNAFRDPTKFPRKVLKFHEDSRPAYVGESENASW